MPSINKINDPTGGNTVDGRKRVCVYGDGGSYIYLILYIIVPIRGPRRDTTAVGSSQDDNFPPRHWVLRTISVPTP